jgi:hypothetical protein
MSLWDNDDSVSWEQSVPADLIPAVKHLRDSFKKTHFILGLCTTQPLCFAQLHNAIKAEHTEQIGVLVELKARIGPEATARFHKLFRRGTAPAVFKAFFDFYIDGLTVQIRLTFTELLQIGRVNQAALGSSCIEWAKSQARFLIRYNRHKIKMWVRDVCDAHAYDPSDKDPFESYWQKWQAPSLLIMKPSRFQPYDPARVWERNDTETSLRWLESFADHYVIRLESIVANAAGDAYLELAKKPKAPATGSADRQQHQNPNDESERQPKVTASKVPKQAGEPTRESLLEEIQNAPDGTDFKTVLAARALNTKPQNRSAPGDRWKVKGRGEARDRCCILTQAASASKAAN